MLERLRSRCQRDVLVGFGLLLLAGLVPAHAAPQQPTGSVSGHVREAESGEPVDAAELTVQGTEKSAVTDRAGYFRMDGIATGNHVLVVKYLGLETREVEFDLYPGELEQIALSLEARAVPVEELVVTVEPEVPVGKLVGFYRRMTRGPGHFITREEIVERGASQPTELLRRVPGLNVGADRFGSAPVTMGRRTGCVPEYFVDGARAPFFNIDNLRSADLAGIEVYRGTSEVPSQFRSRSRCGAIIIWTRDPSRSGG